MFDRGLKDVAFIQRWSIVRKLRNQSVAEHTFMVAHYANDLCVYLGVDPMVHLTVLQHSLWHDVDEIFSGDFPGPNKREMVKDKATWKSGLSRFMTRTFGLDRDNRDGSRFCPVDMWDTVEAIVKTADWLEAAMESGTELQMGNTNVEVHYAHDTEQCVKAAAHLLEVVGKPEMLPDLEQAIRAAVWEARYGQSPGPVMAPEMEDAMLRVGKMVKLAQ